MANKKQDNRITIRLPIDHPLWDYKDKNRSDLARKYIDTGMNVVDILEQVNKSLLLINSKLDKLEELIMNGTLQPSIKTEDHKEDNIQFDTDAFLDI
ncbi:MAG: hypothetical protein FH758_03945 [Firmicutes bacterium]|nr:hypothetical protein [Bacillota bacterium]